MFSFFVRVCPASDPGKTIHFRWGPFQKECRAHSRTEQVFLWDDTVQSSKQMLVCLVLRGKAG